MVGKGCTRDHDNQPDGRNAEILGKWVLKPHLHKQQSIKICRLFRIITNE